MLITLSATGLNVSVHKCCGKITHFTLFGGDEECGMDGESSKKASCFSGDYLQSVATNADACCNNLRIAVHNQLDLGQHKTQSSENLSPAVLLVFRIVGNWLNDAKVPEAKPLPFTSNQHKEPLTILHRQFRI